MSPEIANTGKLWPEPKNVSKVWRAFLNLSARVLFRLSASAPEIDELGQLAQVAGVGYRKSCMADA